MAYNTKPIVTDIDGNPISQYYNPVTDRYEPVEGSQGGNKVVVENNDLSLIPILDKLSQLTGTVIDENTRKTNETSRKSVEATRVVSETARKTAETGRVTAETDRVTKEADRVIKETDRVTKESARVTAETARNTAEGTRKTNETARGNNEVVRVSNEDLRIALYEDLNNKLTSGFFKGAKGDTGNGLEYIWNGTQLGIRVQGTTQYVYVDLKGEKGEAGNIDNLTSSHVTNALGYTPPQQDTITTINGKTGEITKADIVALGIPASNTNTTYAEITTAEIDAGTASTLRTITGRRVKYILDKVQTWIDLLMPKSNGVLENYREKLVTLSGTATTINLNLGNVFKHTLSGTTTYAISNAVASQSHSFTLIITQPSTAYSVSFPASIKWMNETIPDLSIVDKTYYLIFDTIDGGVSWHGRSGGMF